MRWAGSGRRGARFESAMARLVRRRALIDRGVQGPRAPRQGLGFPLVSDSPIYPYHRSMSTPLTLNAYPADMREALQLARENGEFTIPTPNPSALRLRFYGLKRALIRAGYADEIENLTFVIRGDSLIILKATESHVTAAIQAAKREAPVFRRLFGET